MMMKRRKFALLILSITACHCQCFGQCDPYLDPFCDLNPDEPIEAPVDGGMLVLLAAAATYGYRKLRVNEGKR